MRTIPIPHTDLNPAALCLGCADLGLALDREASFALLDAYLDHGGNFLDTAKVYSDWVPGERSRSEKLLAQWLKLRGSRSRVILATKGAHPELSSMLTPRMRPAEITGDLEDSLRHLQVDCIDLYWLHRDDPQRPVAEILETLAAQARAGKIRYYACSNWRAERLAAAQEYAAQHTLPGFVATQVLWNLADIRPQALGDPTVVVMDPALWEYHHATGLAAIPFSSQANGVFQKLAAGGPEALPAAKRAVYLTPETERRFARLKSLSAQTGLSISQLVLAYLTSQPFPTIPIFSARSLTQLEDSLAAADIVLSEAQVRYLARGDGDPAG